MEGEIAEMSESDAEAFKNCRHVCLFCFAKLPAGYREVTSLENVVPSGDILSFTLNDPLRNDQAFDLLCNRLGVKWRKTKEGLNFDETGFLPLCFKCQSLYQEMFQLHRQIQQLEKLITRHVDLIKKTIDRTERKTNTELEVGGTQLTMLGLDVFRKKVVNPGFRRQDISDSIPRRTSIATKHSVSKQEAETSQPISPIPSMWNAIKEEVDEYPGAPLEDMVGGEDDLSSDPLWTHGGAQDGESDFSTSINTADDAFISQEFESEDNEEYIAETEFERKATEESEVRKLRSRTKKRIPSNSDREEKETEDDDISNEEDQRNDSDFDFELERSSRKSLRPRPPPRRVSILSKIRRRTARLTKRPEYHPKKEYTCHICSVKEVGHAAFIKHYDVSHPEENRYTCKFCQRHFRDLRDCVVHQRKHTGEVPFQCPSCSSAFRSKKSLTSHIFHNHTNRSDLTFPCTECDKVFSSKAILNNHLTAVHDHASQLFYKKSGKPTKSWTCHLCDKTVIGHGPFIQHYADLHPEENRYTCKFCQKHFRDLRDCVKHQRKHTGEKPFPCKDCNKAFRDAKALRSHRRHLHSEQPTAHQCLKCDKHYPSKSALAAHMNVHNEALLFCKSCGKGFRNPSSFCKHNKAEHDGQAVHSEPISNPSLEKLQSIGICAMQVPTRIKCHLCWEPIPGRVFLKKHFEDNHPEHQGGLNTCKCGKTFGSYKDCSKHAIRHSTNKKTFQCDQCPLTFFTSTELRVHTSRHAPLEERQNNVCDICGLRLVSPAALIRHKRKHEDNQSRWVCEQCGKSYAEKKGLDHHTKTEHLKILPYKCTYCERAYHLKNDLGKHLRTHTGQKPFKCPLCEKCFPYSSSRARHVREVHNLEGEKGPTPRKKKVKRENIEREVGTHRENKDIEEEERGSTSSTFGGHRQLAAQFGQHGIGMMMNCALNQQQYSLGTIVDNSNRSDASSSAVEMKQDHDERMQSPQNDG